MLDKIKILENTKGKASLKNRNNLLSAFAEFEGKKVKVYEVFNQAQVDLRLFIDKETTVGKCFPSVVYHEGLYIAEEFVEGTPGQHYDVNILRDEVGKLMLALRAIDYQTVTWDYLKHIHERLGLRYTPPPLALGNYINHNDIRLRNIIVTSDGIKMIDNEFLACNNAWFMNVANSDFLTDSALNFGIDDQLIQKYRKIKKLWRGKKPKFYKTAYRVIRQRLGGY